MIIATALAPRQSGAPLVAQNVTSTGTERHQRWHRSTPIPARNVTSVWSIRHHRDG